jgi:hypothetical protein
MADHKDWTADDDAQLRAALGSLRADVEGAPLPDVRFVKARGTARRRQRLFSWTAAAAAAAVVAGTVGYSEFGRDASLQTPPAVQSSTTSSAPSPTTSDSLDQPGALPLLQEWTEALALKGDARMTTQNPKSADWAAFECLTSIPQGQKLRQQVVLDAGGFEGGQTQFAVSAKLDPQTVADGLTADISQCEQGPDFRVNRLNETDAGSLYSYTAGDAGSGWFAVVPGAADVTLIQIADAAHPTSIFTLAQVTALAEIAKQRLARYGSGTTSTPTSTPTTGSSGPKAINEKMPLVGVEPLISSNLFVAASQWSSPRMSNGDKTSAGLGEPEGNDLGGMLDCESDEFLSGVGGRWARVRIKTGRGQANYIGAQRVRLFEGVDAASLAEADVLRTDDLIMSSCTGSGKPLQALAGPSQGTYLIGTDFAASVDKAPRTWVGITTQKTPGAVTTIVFQDDGGVGFTGTHAQGFAELDRLLALARQK